VNLSTVLNRQHSRLNAPSGESPPRSRDGRPLGRISASLEGRTPPRANLRLARGRPELVTPAPTPPTKALNALARRGRPGQKRILATPSLRHRLGIISQRCSANPPREAIPGTIGELCGKIGVNSMTLCCPLPYGLHAAPLERGWRNPQKEYGCLPRAHMGPHRDVGLAERVSSANSGLVRPSPPFCSHLGHCSTIPGAVGARHNKTSPSPSLYIH
jgi:hypothetical protein